MSITKSLTVSLVGKSLEFVYTDLTNGTSTSEYHPICNFVSITGQPQIGFAVRDINTNQRAHRYHSDDMLKVIIETNGTKQNDLEFDLNLVTNQAGWTLDVAGVQQAISDINGWVTLCSDPSGGGAAGATEATQLQVLAAVNGTKDFEMKLIKDTGNGNQIIKEIKTYDQDTGAVVTTYEDAAGAVYVPVGPLVYMDPEAVLTLLLAEYTGADTYANQDISGVGATVIAANSVKSIELIVISGTVTLGAIPFPVGVWPISASLSREIGTALSFDATGATAYLQTLS